MTPTEPYPDAYWRPVKEVPPPGDNLCLVYAPSADADKPLITVAWHSDSFGWALISPVWIGSITHWMPLPPPPQPRSEPEDAPR